MEGLRGSFNFSCVSEYVVFWEFYFICKEDFNEEEMSINLYEEEMSINLFLEYLIFVSK